MNACMCELREVVAVDIRLGLNSRLDFERLDERFRPAAQSMFQPQIRLNVRVFEPGKEGIFSLRSMMPVLRDGQ